MSAKVPCPDIQSLQQLLLGRIPPPDCHSLYDHLETCDQCERTAQTFQADDWLYEALRSQDDGDEAEFPSVLELIESLRRAGPPGLEPVEDGGDHKPTRMSDTIPPPESANARRELVDFLAPAQAPDELGRLGPYSILKVLGSGGMGVVFHAEDPALQRPVALKAMLPGLAARASARSRFLREGHAAAALLHDHIVPIYHVGEDRGIPFLAMPLLPGESLEQRLRREGALPAAEVIRIGREIALGLAAAHAKGLVHRDIKPANLWLESAAEHGKEAARKHSSTWPEALSAPPGRVKILDFGLARPEADANLTQEGTIVGTPLYMAPEQARGEAVDYRADLFSLGSVLYVMCTGRPPFPAASTMGVLRRVVEEAPRSIRDVNPEIPEWLCDVVSRLQAKKPDDRFQSAREVANLLGQYLTELPAHRGARMLPLTRHSPAQRRATPATVSKRDVRRPFVRWGMILAGVGLLLAAGFGVAERMGLFQAGHDVPPPPMVSPQPAPRPPDWMRDAVLVMNFDEGDFYTEDGNTCVRDRSGRRNDGLCEKAAYTPDGKIGGGLAYHGGSLRLPHSLINGASEYTITAWVRMASDDDKASLIYTVANERDLDASAYCIPCFEGSKIAVNAFNARNSPEHWIGAVIHDHTFVRGKWFFLAVRLQNGDVGKGDLRIAIDDRVYTFQSQSVDNGGIGQRGYVDALGCGLWGVLDEVVVFQRALSDAEIAAIRRRGPADEPRTASAGPD